MIRINLLPVRLAKKKENAYRQLSVFFLSILFIASVGGYVWFHLVEQAVALGKELEVVRSDTTRYNNLVKEMADQKKEKELTQEKLNLINQLKITKSGPVRTLDEICTRLPKNRLWLDTVKQDAKGLFIKGMAIDNITIAEYMKNLAGSPYFSNIDLINSEQKVIKDTKLMEFILMCQTKAPDVPIGSEP
ncbi:MAG: PilN domain-containing protein [Pseudomonadota bacterium]